METVVKSIVEKIDREIENARNALAQDTMRLIRIKSVKGNPAPGALFGEGPKAVLDEVVRMARFEGFYTTDYGVGVVSAALKNKQPDLGIWLHGDVVPEGEGWLMPPYEPIEYKGCIIGRGATDNKGQLAAIFNLLKIFKNLGVPLCYNPAMYVGSDEESGMHDLAGIPDFANAPGFLKSCTPPKLSLVPDAGFPVGYGGKGSVYITLRTKKPLEGYTLTAGQENSPGRACAYFENADALRDMPEAVHTDDGGAEISTYSPPRHASSPDPNGNMITRLMEILLDKELVPKADRAVLEFFKQLSLDIHGNSLQINAETHTMKPLTVFAQKIETVRQYAELTINIRYPIEIAAEEIDRRLSCAAAEKGAVISKTRHTAAPYLLNPEQPVVLRLNRIANEITGSDAKPYTLSGATYAHCLPNALVYGMDGCLPPEDFPGGHGGAHGTDESVSLNRLQRGMKIYARALLALNEMEWR